VAGKTATYRATSYNVAIPPPDEVRQINWIVKSDDQTVARFDALGDTLSFDVPASLIDKTIRVMPFRNSPTPMVSVISRVVSDGISVGTGSKVTLLSREEWGARTDLPRLGAIVARTRRTHVFIHHTDIVDDDPSPNEFETADEVKRKMRALQTVRPDLGDDVPYSMVAFCMSDGGVLLCEGRGLDRSGAHTIGHNTAALGISFQGDFENKQPPAALDANLIGLGDWLRHLRVEQGFVNLGADRPLGREVFGHREVKPTDCPGKHIFAKLSLVRFL